MPWDDVAARARGLSSRLLRRSDLVALAGSSDLGHLARQLTSMGRAPSKSATLDDLELALRRRRAETLVRLATWAGDRLHRLAVVFDGEDRRSLITVLRHLGAPGAPALRGLTPTPSLPERALETLASLPDLATALSLLTAWQHPLVRNVDTSSLAAVERSLQRTSVQRANQAARWGDGPLRRYTATRIDLLNATTLLVQQRQPVAARDAEAWLPGGTALDRDRWTALLAGSLGEAVRAVASRLGTLGEALVAAPPGAESRAVLGALLPWWRRIVRLDPVSTAPILQFALRLRAEAVDLRTVLWGVSMGAPAEGLRARLVTP